MGLVQGFVALLMYWLLGVEDPWLWFAVTFVSGMLPVVGVALAYVPLTLMLLANGQEWQALLIFLYSFIVVGSVDNLARMWLLKNQYFLRIFASTSTITLPARFRQLEGARLESLLATWLTFERQRGAPFTVVACEQEALIDMEGFCRIFKKIPSFRQRTGRSSASRR